MDEDGYFFMTDRLKRMINASGFKVWPAEVEALMFSHPAIQEACVIAAKDAYRGETVKAVVLRQAFKGRSARKTSFSGAANTWRSTRCRAWCSLPMPCPRAAAAR
jgi:fatty-acyl-CoA synthase